MKDILDRHLIIIASLIGAAIILWALIIGPPAKSKREQKIDMWAEVDPATGDTIIHFPDAPNGQADIRILKHLRTTWFEIDSATGDRIVHFPSGGTVRYFKHIDPYNISITAVGTGLTKEEANIPLP